MVFFTALSACSLADPELFRALEGDGGVDDGGDLDVPTVDAPEVDAGPGQLAINRCDPDEVNVLRETTRDIAIDTREFTSNINALEGCSVSGGVSGNDAFLAVEVSEGEEWHFHLRVDPEAEDPSMLNPTLYVLPASDCSGRACAVNLLANFCSGSQDEHFAHTFATSGMFFIGIDDSNTGGGQYLLDAIQPFCGNDVPEHGEACEGAADCSRNCRFMLSETSVREKGFNFNFKEANEIILPASNELTIQGDLGGFEGCAYPDVYAIQVPAGQTLLVEERNAVDGTACTGAGATSIRINLFDAGGSEVSTPMMTGGCSLATHRPVGDGLFYAVLTDLRRDTDTPYLYQLLFRVTP